MEIISLGSGSKGNSFYLNINGMDVLIDVGLSMKKINERLLIECGIDIEDIDIIFITHSHSDHTKSLFPIYRKYHNVKFAFVKPTYDSVVVKEKRGITKERRIIFDENTRFEGKSFILNNYSLQHDEKNYAFKFTDKSNGETFLHLPDNGGYIRKEIKEKWVGCDYYSIESNYDTYLQVTNEERPLLTARRALGGYGHMSNHDAIFLLFKLVRENTKGVMFQHLSEECNSPELAQNYHERVTEIFGNKTLLKNLNIVYATQEGVHRLI